MENKIQKFRIAADVGTDEMAKIDFVARILDPVSPKKTQSFRYLIKLGFQKFQELESSMNCTFSINEIIHRNNNLSSGEVENER